MNFMRWASLTINGVKINHEEQDGLYFEVEYNSGKDNEIGVCKIRIYNLSQDIEVGSVIDYDFGRDLYGGRFGTFVVKKRNEIIDKADKVQELLCSERAVESSNTVSVSLKGQISSSDAIREICNQAGLNMVQVELEIEKTYPNSFSCFGKATDELKKIADNTSSKFKIEGKDVYFYKDKPKSKFIIDLNFNSGLIKNPAAAEEITLDSIQNKKAQNKEIEANYLTEDKLKSKLSKEYDFTIECMSLHSFKKGNIVNISGSDTFNGLCRICSLEMRNTNKWITTLKVKVM